MKIEVMQTTLVIHNHTAGLKDELLYFFRKNHEQSFQRKDLYLRFPEHSQGSISRAVQALADRDYLLPSLNLSHIPSFTYAGDDTLTQDDWDMIKRKEAGI